MEQSQARGDEEDAAPDLEGVAGGEIFENNHSIGSEILESMFGVYEVFGNLTPFGKEISITVAESYWCTARAGWMAAGRLVGTSGQCSRSAAEGKAQLLHAGNDETENLRAPTTHSTGTAYRVSTVSASRRITVFFLSRCTLSSRRATGLAWQTLRAIVSPLC